jgi:hypothetical protein
MRTLYRAVFTIALSAAVLSPLAYAQRDDDRRDRDERHEERGPYGRARGLVGRVLHDMERAQTMAPVAGRQRDRYDNARRHLSQFDDRLSQGDFDKDKLDVAIDDLKNVVRGNVLSPRSRDDLRDDLDALRAMREARGRI